jgi:predicted dehydrogenase
MVEPLSAELGHVLECVRTGARPLTDGWNGVDVVSVLEAVDASLRQDGAEVMIQGRPSPAAVGA